MERTWLDLGDIAYRQGAGCFHVAAEAYGGALKRAGNLFPPHQQVGKWRNNQALIHDVGREYGQHCSRVSNLYCFKPASGENLVSVICSVGRQSSAVRFSRYLEQESIAYRIAKCCSRCGDLAGAVSGIEELLYTRNFWSERYRYDVFLRSLHPVPDNAELPVFRGHHVWVK